MDPNMAMPPDNGQQTPAPSVQSQNTQPQMYTPIVQEKNHTGWIIVGVLLLVMILGVGAYWYFNKDTIELPWSKKTSTEVVTPPSANPPAGSDKSPIIPLTPPVATPEPTATTSPEVEKAWAAMQAVILAADAHDIAAFNALLAVPRSACKTPNEECSMIMDNTQAALSMYGKEDITKVWEGSTQFVVRILTKDKISATVYFTKNAAGELDYLSVTSMPYASLDEIVDTDEDGLTDLQETCSGPYASDSTCKKTDPNDYDTDKNGYWDGTDMQWNIQVAAQAHRDGNE